MATATQVAMFLENKPGALARVAAALAKAKVNVEAISVCETQDYGVVRMVTSSAAKTKAALKKLGVSFTTSRVIVTKLPNTPGVLAKVSKKLAKAGVNIEYVYGSAAGKGRDATIVIKADKTGKAAAALR